MTKKTVPYFSTVLANLNQCYLSFSPVLLHTSPSSFLPLNKLSRLPLSPSPSIYPCETPSKYLFNAKMTSHGCQITTCPASLRVESVPKKCVHYYFPPNPKAGGKKAVLCLLSSFSLWEFSSRDLGLLTLA